MHGTLDRRLTPADRIADLPVREHARRHIAACLRLGKLPQLKDLRLAAWAHMLGFRGHFSTKSRAYSVTLGSLRADRAAHQREYAIATGLQPDLDPGTTLVPTDWHYAGRAVEVKPKTLQDYRHLVSRHVRPYIGELRLQAMSPARLTKLYRDLATNGGRDGAGLSPRTVE